MKPQSLLATMAFALLCALPVLADEKISQIQNGGSLQAGDLLPIVRIGLNYSVPWSNICGASRLSRATLTWRAYSYARPNFSAT